MAKYFLINTVVLAAGTIYPGTELDSAADPVTAIQNAGGVLVLSTNLTVAAAALEAQSLRKRGAAPEEQESVMQAAYSKSVDERSLTIGTAEIEDLAVTTGKLAANAVTTAKITDANVTAAKLANGAGVAALLTAGLGNSIIVDDDDAATQLRAPDAVKGRACLVVAVVTEALTTTAAFAVASVGGVTLLSVPALTALNTVLVGAGIVPAHAVDSEIKVTPTAGDTGKVAVTILALPTT